MQEIVLFLERLGKEIDTKKDFEFWKFLDESEKILKNAQTKIGGTVDKNAQVTGTLVLGKNSHVMSGSVIEGNVFVGENCKIGPNAYLRGSVMISDNCHIGMSEVKNSIFLSNSNAPHFNYVGDSILGENVNLGAGTKVANLRHDNESIKVRINGKLVDSTKRKLGALIGTGTKTGVNSSINCGKIVPNNSKILPNEFYK